MGQIALSSEQLRDLMERVKNTQEQLGGLYEELELLSNRELMNEVQESIIALDRGEGVSLREFKKVVNEDQ